MAGKPRPRAWDDAEEIEAALNLTFSEFQEKYPDRSEPSWRNFRGRYRQDPDFYADLIPRPEMVRKERAKHPNGWEPGVRWDGTKGQIATGPMVGPNPQWEELLRQWDFDPEKYEVVEPIQFRTWDAATGSGEVKRMYYYRATIRSRVVGHLDVDALIEEVKQHKPSTKPKASGSTAFVVALSDWQLGKAGTAGTVERLTTLIDSVETRVTDLRKIGRDIGQLYVLGLGDIIEGCDGHYAMQTFTVELTRRDQVKLGRRILVQALTRWSSLFDQVVVAAIGGNHGENRRDGAAYTTFADNDDVAVFEQVAEVLSANPAYKHVSFNIPNDELALTMNVSGKILGIAHGHQARSGATLNGKLINWWKGQEHGMRPIGDADILVAGHFHQLMVHQDGARTLMVAPTLDSGSPWFADTSGSESKPGTLTFTVSPGGWSDLHIL